MPDSNGDPPPPGPESTAPEPAHSPTPKAIRPAPLIPAPRANPTSVFNPKDAPASAPATPAGFSDFVTWMQSVSAPPAAPPPMSAPDGRALLPKEQKKFHRIEQDSPKTDHPPAAHGQSPEDEIDGGVAASHRTPRPPLATPAPDQVPVIRRRRPKQTGVAEESSFRFPWRLLVLAAMLAGSFFYGRKTAFDAAARTQAPASRVASNHHADDALFSSLFDQAMAAEQHGDYPQAIALLQQAQQKGSRTPGIDYRLALLAYESGDFPRAMSLLNHSVDLGEEVAASYDLRGLINNRTAGINRGLADLETATQLDPFEARYYYYLGEALRRNGKPQAALNDLLHAVDRLREPELDSLYHLKVRLAQIELGQENEFADQLAAELQRTPPSVDWLLTAAALEMHGGRLDAAAGYLDKAAALADERTLNSRLRDYFFYSFANEKALARFYAGIHKADAALASRKPAPDRPKAESTPSPALTASPTP